MFFFLGVADDENEVLVQSARCKEEGGSGHGETGNPKTVGPPTEQIGGLIIQIEVAVTALLLA